jgi:hypothetical protein
MVLNPVQSGMLSSDSHFNNVFLKEKNHYEDNDWFQSNVDKYEVKTKEICTM